MSCGISSGKILQEKGEKKKPKQLLGRTDFKNFFLPNEIFFPKVISVFSCYALGVNNFPPPPLHSTLTSLSTSWGIL
jgi:hypothetical protein